MQTTLNFAGNIQELISLNYQRMMAFEQAAFNSTDSTQQAFYTQRAEESEAYLKELYAALNMSEEEGEHFAASQQPLSFVVATRKNSRQMLTAIILFERTVIAW